MPTLNAPLHGKCILLVEDDEHIRFFIRRWIQQEMNHLVISCRTAHEALVVASIMRFHLFILDYRLPDLNGLALYDQFQTFAHLKDLPTIMISAYQAPTVELQQRHIPLLNKPFYLLPLLTSIEQALA